MSREIDLDVRDDLATALGFLNGDYDTWFARGKILGYESHRRTAEGLMTLFDITPRKKEND